MYTQNGQIIYLFYSSLFIFEGLFGGFSEGYKNNLILKQYVNLPIGFRLTHHLLIPSHTIQTSLIEKNFSYINNSIVKRL